MPLMEDIVLSIVPVRERRTITAGLLDRLRRLDNLINFALSSLAFLTSEFSFIRSCEVHPVGIDNLAFFLEIKGLFVRFNLSLRQLAVIVLTIVRKERLGIRVLHKSIRASSHSGTLVLVTRGQWIVYHSAIQTISQ